MLIECSFCHTRAQILESQEGAKVRCGDCGRTYVARPAGVARKAKESNPMPYVLGGGLVVVGAILFSVISNNKPAPRRVEPTVEEEVVSNDTLGWESEAAMAARGLYEAAKGGNRTRLVNRIAGEQVLAREIAAAAVEGYEGPAPSSEVVWGDLKGFQRTPLLESWADSMMDTSDENAPVNWTPYDGGVKSQNGAEYILHISCTPAGGGSKAKVFEWIMIRDGATIRAASWDEYIDPATVKQEFKKRNKGIEKVTLSDGSRVFERQPEPLEHLEGTPAELITEMDALFATITNLDLTTEIGVAKDRLEEIGKPAIPMLLTGLYEIPLDTEDQARQVQNIVDTLRRITGNFFGFEPLILQGSSMGTTEERRTSSIKQWFAWWYSKGKKFEVAAKEDVLAEVLGEISKEDQDYITRFGTPEEKQWLKDQLEKAAGVEK
ncbi:MAG: hypothetical protein P8R48_10585 [Planctomycetota bacterium]|nr:hypothetical protein [Planctomycetota bacterium]